ncbi:transporter substrate-binding domain-containing protein [Streptomyces sp. OE57]|uniref:transporter substrate-binding domain-containing protein n=1 Tax=Streptomyces lacaronensis TaxID=3379885 RepID=UPI0039B74D34
MEITDSTALARDLAPTGVLRASINLGNPVLAQGTPDAPGGVTVDLAREMARRLGLPVEFICFDAARKSYEAMATGHADLCFLAIEPAREAEIAFTPPYVHIEGVYAVPAESPLRTPGEVDSPGIRIGVKQGSAYDLFLTRTLAHAGVVRGPEGLDVFHTEKTGGRGRNPAAADGTPRRTPRTAPGRARVHDHPAGRRDDEDTTAGHRALPERDRGPLDGLRVHRRSAEPVRAESGPGRADGAVNEPSGDHGHGPAGRRKSRCRRAPSAPWPGQGARSDWPARTRP